MRERSLQLPCRDHSTPALQAVRFAGVGDAVHVSAQDDVRSMGSRAFAAYQERYSLAAARGRYWQEWGRQR